MSPSIGASKFGWTRRNVRFQRRDKNCRARRRTPPSFTYRPLPLHLVLEPIALELPELGAVKAPRA